MLPQSRAWCQLSIVDEFTHECLAIDVAGSIRLRAGPVQSAWTIQYGSVGESTALFHVSGIAAACSTARTEVSREGTTSWLASFATVQAPARLVASA
jgi:hypothetical protein